MYSETTGSSDTVQVTARLHGRENTVIVRRDNVDMLPVGAGAGLGAGACMTGGLISGLASLVFVPCAFVGGPVSWAACAAAPLAGWWFFSHKMPDVVRVELGEPPRVSALPASEPSSEVAASN